jgi:hypothetical protein
VLTRSCRPLRGAVVDLWHANETGEYDNIGFRWPCYHWARRRVPLSHHRAGALLWPHEALSRQGSGAWQPSTDYAAVFSQRAGKPP